MDEELGVKVTRLRRRLSVEAEGTQSPATPSTPTKKRGGRLAKPALELIDENVTENVPKRSTRKSVARDVVEPAEEKAVTPSRRSTRIRSNTSLVAESFQSALDSPRAKRAARRNSQLESDTETSSTPLRQTRRARKDSTSSVEKLAITNPSEKLVVQVAEVIAEEPEKETGKDSKVDNSNNVSPPLRKSPRLNKKGKKSIGEAGEDNSTLGKKDERVSDPTKLSGKTSQSFEATTTIANNENMNKTDETSQIYAAKNAAEKAPVHTNKIDKKFESNDSEKENLSVTSSNLINEIENIPKISSGLNKTTSAIHGTNNEDNHRKRTKSWTTSPKNLSVFDKIISKNNNQNSLVSAESNFETDVIESKRNTPFLNSEDVLDSCDTEKILEKNPSKDMQSLVLIEDSDSNTGSLGKLCIDIQNDIEQTDFDDQCVPVVKQSTTKRSPRKSESFACEPMDIDETIPGNVTINDFSDKTNSSREEVKLSDSRRKSSLCKENIMDMSENSNKSKRTSSISIQQEFSNSKRKFSTGSADEKNNSKAALNKSNSVSVSDKSHRKFSTSSLEENANKSKINSSLTKSNKRKSSNSSNIEDINNINESARKSSVSGTELQNLETTTNESKSTLVLSQLKDISTNEISNVSKSQIDTINPDVVKGGEADKKNLSLNYLTSTPLQQKPLQKIAMQINSSLISPNSESKNNTKVNTRTPKKNSSRNSDTSSDESDEVSNRRSSMVADEAEEASEDYESGDSRGDEERQYEEDHEIVEKGETLESEQEFSNDSEYEKDSFIVSSDEEDDELLSGSGDDLSLSDNELKMTAKSKKKFDERKRKEQKKASREMYEARHQLSESDKNSKSKCKLSKRQRLESALLESDKEDEVQPNKKVRLRIDSSQDSMNTSDVDESVRVMKKKSKRLSESVSEETSKNDEKEITICNQSAIDKKDPLSVAVKLEPKTPQKDLDISMVLINDNIEEVQVEANASVMNANETSDPLQATVAQDEESDSDISEQMEIKRNYDSVLENLNKANNKQKQTKNLDWSLNLNKKTKNKAEPLVDQLNLTQTKKTKKNKSAVVESNGISQGFQVSNSKEVSVVATKIDEGDTSDSIDMQLLFPEDSNDSEVNANIMKSKDKKIEEPAEEFIPLKRTEAKTNIRENMAEDTSMGFFIDTKGTHEDVDTSMKTNSKKKQKHSLDNGQNHVQTTNEEIDSQILAETEGAEHLPLEVSFKSDKKKKKNKNKHGTSLTMDQSIVMEMDSVPQGGNKMSKLSVSAEETKCGDDNATAELMPAEVTTKKKKKCKNKKEIDVDEYINEEQVMEMTGSNSEKKKSKKVIESTMELDKILNEDAAPEETPSNVSLNSNKKKKKNKSFDVSQTVVENTENIEELGGKKKKKNKTNNMSMPNQEPVEMNESGSVKNKSKKSQSAEDSQAQQDVITPDETPSNVSQNSDKKKKKKKKKNSLDVSQGVVDITGENPDEAPLEVSYKSEKNYTTDIPGTVDNDNAVSTSSEKKKKKKKKNMSPQLDQNVQNASRDGELSSKKRKREVASFPSTDDAEDEVTTGSVPEKTTKKQKKKKLKVSQDEDAPTEERIDYTGHVLPIDDIVQKKTNKNKKSKSREIVQDTKQEAGHSKSKKRKATDDDDSQKKPKVFKENSFDKIHVPRLPESIVTQLDDKPPKQFNKEKKVKAISTMPFKVEDAKPRKNKPSNYLEQSIYLNDSPVQKKQKASIKNPKVLPFIPTAITSGKGYTSNFNINVLPKDTQFVAQAGDVPNFKNEYLSSQRTKLGTFERFKKQRNHKLSKF